MGSSDSGSLYHCPLCETPAPSVAACKIHISRCNDAVHWGYVGNDLHDEIVAHQLLTDRGPLGRLRHLLFASGAVDRLRRRALGLLSSK